MPTPIAESDLGSDPRRSDEPELARLRAGCVIPAHPLALDDGGRFDERHQRALTRYYLDAGAGGIAIGVHSTEFAIHWPCIGLYEPVLALAAETARSHGSSPILISGVAGATAEAVREAEVARDLGYHGVLLMPLGAADRSESQLIERARAVGEVLPVIGFYLQPAVGGRDLGADYWRRLADIPTVVGVKVAPFDRYRTLDVLRGIASSDRVAEIAIYTGNDDTIVSDLLTPAVLADRDGDAVTMRIVGGLLGQWGVWTSRAVELYRRIRSVRVGDAAAARDVLDLLRIGSQLTDANRVIFDAAGGFRGCVPGVKEVLRRQGLLASTRCLDPYEVLSPGQASSLDEIHRAYPALHDDDYVAENLDRWLS